MINSDVQSELRELKQLTLLGTKKVLTTDDCALLTGLSKSYLYKLTASNKIPFYKGPGGKFCYFNKEEIEGWLMQHRAKTVDEIQAEATTYLLTGKYGRTVK